MKKVLFLGVLSSFAFADCSHKIAHLEQKLEYAKKYNNINQQKSIQQALDNARMYCGNSFYQPYSVATDYDMQKDKLEDEYEEKIERIEDELDNLSDMKHTMSKSEYKAKKSALKAQKRQLKSEYKSKKRALKYGY